MQKLVDDPDEVELAGDVREPDCRCGRPQPEKASAPFHEVLSRSLAQNPRAFRTQPLGHGNSARNRSSSVRFGGFGEE
jgi:hypothetical protein